MEQSICPGCGAFLVEPYIKCTTCTHNEIPVSLCLHCFAKGHESNDHKNNHSFVIMRNNFSLFGSTWMAYEELKLLNAISQCGMGNWSDIADMVGTKTKAECEKHYLKYYIENPHPALPAMKKREVVAKNYPDPIIYVPGEDPPRPDIASAFYNEMAGYMPGRGDFGIEYDDYAELDLKDLDFVNDNDPISTDLQLAVIKIYQRRLKERARRKCILRNYGLISAKKNSEELRRYISLGRPVNDRMKTMMKLLRPFDFDKLMEGILCETKFKNRIKTLQECRQVGITEINNIEMFLKLKKDEQERKRDKSLLDNMLTYMKDDVSRQQYLRKQILTENSSGLLDTSFYATGRRTAPPLSICGLPGYDKLTEKERNLCSALRLYPAAFLQHKATLLHEYRKLGSLRLANARAVIKIDVNKTRKIYDLLMEEGLVSK